MNKNLVIAFVVLVLLGGLSLIFGSKAPAPPSDETGTENSGWEKGLITFGPITIPTPSLAIPTRDDGAVDEVWKTFQDYLAAAKAHDLDGIKRLSYRLSRTCANSKSEEECFGLMDSVYGIASGWQKEWFTSIWHDDRQVVLGTDKAMEGGRVLIFFTKESGGGLKVLGIRLCFGGSVSTECPDENSYAEDSDGDGWWDSTELLFE